MNIKFNQLEHQKYTCHLIISMRNFVDYSFPDTVEKSTFVSGEEVLINVPAGCQSIRVDTPDNNVLYLDTENATCVFVPTEVGVHTVTVTVANTQKVYNVFASMKEAERRPAVSKKEIALQGEAKAGGFDGKYDMMTLLFIILALLFIADWMVYCYEKYQLR